MAAIVSKSGDEGCGAAWRADEAADELAETVGRQCSPLPYAIILKQDLGASARANGCRINRHDHAGPDADVAADGAGRSQAKRAVRNERDDAEMS